MKFQGEKSSTKSLVGGGPQGTLLGGLEYIISNDDCLRDETQKEDRFKYYDDLNLLEFLILTDKLREYDFSTHVASDIGISQSFLPSENYQMQKYLTSISDWTDDNLILLNEKKSCYIEFSRSKSEFSTRLALNGIALERKSVIRVLGVWLQDDMKWDYNTKQICIKAYSRVQIINRLKYAGICEGELITIYKLFIRSICEYSSSVFHTSLTQELSDKLEAIQKTALKIILADKYIDYQTSLEHFSIDTLYTRRQKHMEKFAIKCTEDKLNHTMFPTNQNVRGKDLFQVNFARTSQYLNSTIPQCQRFLNTHSKKNTS